MGIYDVSQKVTLAYSVRIQASSFDAREHVGLAPEEADQEM